MLKEGLTKWDFPEAVTGSTAAAKTLISNYNKHANPLKFKSGLRIQGFSLPVSEMQNLIDHKSKKADRIFMALGYHDGTGPTGREGHTLVVFGLHEDMGNNRLMIENDDLIYDYCEPCPPLCPDNVELENL